MYLKIAGNKNKTSRASLSARLEETFNTSSFQMPRDLLLVLASQGTRAWQWWHIGQAKCSIDIDANNSEDEEVQQTFHAFSAIIWKVGGCREQHFLKNFGRLFHQGKVEGDQ
jgi:hypothetical protein